MSDKTILQWIENPINKILAGVITAAIIASGSWAWQINNQISDMNTNLTMMNMSLQSLIKDMEKREIAATALERRLQRIEDTKIKASELERLRRDYGSLRERVIRLEISKDNE